MPLVLLTGPPSTGKTRHAQALAVRLERAMAAAGATATGECDAENVEPPRLQSSSPDAPSGAFGKVVLVNDESLRIDRRKAYSDPTAEKSARGLFLSTIERMLNARTVVIADGMNYIKGYRYQLFLHVRSQNTTHCVVHCAAPVEVARAWNEARAETERYDARVFEELTSRYEEPREMNRWDAPLFTLHAGDDPYIEEMVYARVIDAIFKRRPQRVTFANLPQPVSSTAYVYDVDRVTQSVVQAVLDAQRNGTDASPMGVPVNMVDTSTSTPSTTTPLKTPPTLYPPPNITQMELRRMRKQFLAMNKSEAVRVDAGRVSQLFVDYLNGQWGRL